MTEETSASSPDRTPLQETILDIMSNFAASVTVVTSTHQGRDHGLTVSAFTSVSLDPPLVLVCIDRRANSRDAIRAAGGFTVNLLRDGTGDAAMKFAAKDDDKFSGFAVRSPEFELAGPLLPEQSYATLECRTVESVDGGDHLIVIGAVEVARRIDPAAPLVYWRRGFARVVNDEAGSGAG